jgi:predicted GH43/DUF377 family glycosyl hydrolase
VITEYNKIGLIFQANAHYDWMHYYAAPMTAVEFPDFIRVYFTTRGKIDEQGFFRTYICFLDCDKKDPTKILYLHNQPVLEVGTAGTFDEHGTMIADVIEHNGKYYMYYIGWQRSGTAPYINTIGLAMSDNGKDFTKVSAGPIIGLNRSVPYGLGNLSVIVDNGVFRMWYTHYKPWIKTPIGYRPHYDIRHAYSADGIDWQFDEESVIPANENEAIATPCTRKINGTYHMWYSYRPSVDATGKSGAYMIGYAVSEDGKLWKRADDVVTLKLSESGWDSEMICAPDVLELDGVTYMFYCGNMYGRDGFGYSIIK